MSRKKRRREDGQGSNNPVFPFSHCPVFRIFHPARGRSGTRVTRPSNFTKSLRPGAENRKRSDQIRVNPTISDQKFFYDAKQNEPSPPALSRPTGEGAIGDS